MNKCLQEGFMLREAICLVIPENCQSNDIVLILYKYMSNPLET